MLLIGIILSVVFFQLYGDISISDNNLGELRFKIIYLLLFISSILVVFFKPQQEHLEATETRAKEQEVEIKSLKRELGHSTREIANMSQGVVKSLKQFEQNKDLLKQKELHLNSTVKELEKQVEQLQQNMANMPKLDDINNIENLKEEFLRNLQHETNAPLTAIISKSDALYNSYDTLDPNVVKSTVKDIIIGSDRLKTYVNNLVDTATLTKANNAKLDKVHKINLSNLIKRRAVSYKKTFADDKQRPRFKLEIEPNLMVECNEYYITQLFDNLISNADQYGNNSIIEISLRKMNSIMVEFKITDHGIGIPKEELHNVFKSFTTSSKTHTQAGGRGLGLSLCQKVIDAHQGKILAESDSKNGTSFMFVIPFNYHYKGVEL